MSRRVWLFLTALILILGFTYFSYLVHKKSFNQLDFDTTVRLQDHISHRWDLPFWTFSLLGSPQVTLIGWFLLLIFVLIKRYWLTAVSLFLFFISVAAELFGKIVVLHPGPPFMFYRGGEIAPNFSFTQYYVQTNYSYPSGHITRTAFLITFIFLLLQFKLSFKKRVVLQIGLIGFYIVMLTSRIYLGEHWLSDIIGGILLGTSLASLSAITIPIHKNRI